MAFVAIFITVAAAAQSGASCCPLKDSPLCPMKASITANADEASIADCPWKGTPQCPLVNRATTGVALTSIEDCPLRGTPLCPMKTAATDTEAPVLLASTGNGVSSCCAKKQ